MDHRRRLAAVSAAQLATGVAGMVVALRREHPYEFLILRGRADKIARDSILLGTALSAPVAMLATQAVAIRSLLASDDPAAESIARLLGAVMVVGYLGEKQVRHRLRHPDPVETTVAVTGIALAAAMAQSSATTSR
jgi:hypothetical protein